MELPTTSFFKRKLKEKVHDAVRDDTRKYGFAELKIADARAVVQESDGRCENCGCEMLFDDWRPWCLHQFTFDRVDLTLPHSKDNVRLLCFYCNAHIGTRRDPHGKLMWIPCPKHDCLNGCHVGVVPRPVVRSVARPTKEIF